MSVLVPEEVIARQAPEAQQIIRALLAYIETLEQRIRDLEQRLPANPASSSVPPSTVHPHAKPASTKARSKRSPGGQPGHARCERPLLPSEQCAQVILLKPSACRRCGQALQGCDSQPLRHQVWELPDIKPIVTEYQRHRLCCPDCGESTCAALPDDVPTVQAGPRLVALTGLLLAHYRQSKRKTASFLGSVLGQPASPGWVVKLQQQAAAAVAIPYQQLAEQLPQQEQLGIDESPTKQGKLKAWLWTFVATAFTVFAYRTSRKARVPEQLLGAAYAGVIVCDRAKMYWALGRLQWCWAHLLRDFQSLADDPNPTVKRLGHDLRRPTRQLFALWAKCRDGTLSRAAFVAQMKPIREQIENALLRGCYRGGARGRGMCRELYRNRERLWTFVEVEGIEPTNNASERALRHAVIWRKLSFGTQSEGGSRFVERMLTVIETCRQQTRDVFGYLTAAVQAHFAHQPAPSLLPTS
jgi:transposase